MIVVFFFFKQKTAYEMRISDWSSDVCSSDLAPHPADSGRPRPCASAWASALDFGPGLRPWTSAGALFSGLRQPPSTDAIMVGTLGGAVLLADGPDQSVDLAPDAGVGDPVEGLNELQGIIPTEIGRAHV